MSEGIDFKDQLCRCVFSIGIPIANIFIPFIHYKKLRDNDFLKN
jgi:Rad3-related DNA helicase